LPLGALCEVVIATGQLVRGRLLLDHTRRQRRRPPATVCRLPDLSPNSEVWTRSRPRRRPRSSMRRRFLRRKEPDFPAIISFRYSGREPSQFSKDDDEHEDDSSISEFRLSRLRRGKNRGA
jgi:hypothetical protein